MQYQQSACTNKYTANFNLQETAVSKFILKGFEHTHTSQQALGWMNDQ